VSERAAAEKRPALIRNPLPWPDGHRCAVSLSFDVDAESILHLAHPQTAHNKVKSLSRLSDGPIPELQEPRQ
jgi:hypothetical protein